MHFYSQVYNYILNQIQTGVLSEGDIIPKETELSATFNISRPTVRQALQMLVNEGYLIRIKGKGSFVTKPKFLQHYTKFIESYSDEMSKKGLVSKTKILEISLMLPNEIIQKHLCVDENTKIVKLKRLRYIVENNMNKPMVLTTVYFKYSLLPDVFNIDFETQSFYSSLEQNNIHINKVERFLEVRTLNSKNSILFGLPDNFPCHYIYSIGYDMENYPIEYSENYYPSDRNRFIIEIKK